MNETAHENWNDQGEEAMDHQGDYNEEHEQQQPPYDPNTAAEGQAGDYNMMQQMHQDVNNNNYDEEEEDEEDDILDEMEDGNPNQYDPNHNDPSNTNSADQSSVLLMRFCPHDSSMLYPKECKRTKTLRYACGIRGCNYSEETHTNMVYQNILKKEVQNVLHKVLSAVSDDPALPRTQNESCESCGYNEAVFFQSDTSDVRNDSLALIFVCCSCGHKWVK